MCSLINSKLIRLFFFPPALLLLLDDFQLFQSLSVYDDDSESLKVIFCLEVLSSNLLADLSRKRQFACHAYRFTADSDCTSLSLSLSLMTFLLAFYSLISSSSHSWQLISHSSLNLHERRQRTGCDEKSLQETKGDALRSNRLKFIHAENRHPRFNDSSLLCRETS